jgi:hypothetical protein
MFISAFLHGYEKRAGRIRKIEGESTSLSEYNGLPLIPAEERSRTREAPLPAFMRIHVLYARPKTFAEITAGAQCAPVSVANLSVRAYRITILSPTTRGVRVLRGI